MTWPPAAIWVRDNEAVRSSEATTIWLTNTVEVPGDSVRAVPVRQLSDSGKGLTVAHHDAYLVSISTRCIDQVHCERACGERDSRRSFNPHPRGSALT